MPVGAPTFCEGLRMGAEVFHALKKTLHDRGLGTGGRRRGRLRARSRLQRGGARGADRRASRPPATRPATTSRSRLTRPSSEIYKDGAYVLEHEDRTLSADELAAYWADLAGRYPIISLEDGMAEEDWDGLEARSPTSSASQHPARRRRPVRHQHRAAASAASTPASANSILIKVNQIGTLTETLDAIAHGARGRLHARSCRTAPARPRT